MEAEGRLNADLNKQRSEFPDDLQTLGNIQHSKITPTTFNTITVKQIMKYAIGSHCRGRARVCVILRAPHPTTCRKVTIPKIACFLCHYIFVCNFK